MAKKIGKAQLVRNMIDDYYNTAVKNNQAQAQAMAQQQAKAPAITDSGLTKADIDKMYAQAVANQQSQAQQPTTNEIPSLEQNTPKQNNAIPNSLPSLSELTAQLNDPNAQRTEGETKALNDYVEGLKQLKEATYKNNYNEELKGLKSQLDDATATRTEGEQKALEDYYAGLTQLQKEIDRYNAPKYAPTTNSKMQNNQKKLSSQEKAKKYGEEMLSKAKSGKLEAHGYSFSSVEDRDRQRALEAQQNAKKNVVTKEEVAKEENPLLAKGMTGKTEFGTLTKAQPTPSPEEAINNLIMPTSELPKAQKTEAKVEETADTLLASQDRWTSQQKAKANELVKDYFKNNELANKLHHSSNPNISQKIIEQMTPDEYNEYQKMVALQSRGSNASSFVSGMLDAIPGVRNLADKYSDMVGVDDEYNFSNTNQMLKEESPIANKGGNFVSKAAQYGIANELLGAIPAVASAKNAVSSGIASAIGTKATDVAMNKGMNKLTRYLAGNGAKKIGDSVAGILTDTIPDLALDTIPEAVANAKNGDSASEVAIKALENIGVNTALNVGAESLNYIPELASTVKGLINKNGAENIVENAVNTTKTELNPVDLARQNAEGVDNIAKRQADIIQNIEDLERNRRNAERMGLDGYVGDDVTLRNIPEASVNNQVADNVNPFSKELEKEFPTSQTPEMRARQNATPVSNVVNPKELTDIESTGMKGDVQSKLDYYNMPDEVRSAVSEKINELDNIVNEFNNAQSKEELVNVMDRLEALSMETDSMLKGNATIPVTAEGAMSQAKKDFANAMKGRQINLSSVARGELPDETLRDLNNAIYNGSGSGRFYKSKGADIDASVFNEIDEATGRAISSYMSPNGLDPENPLDMARGLVDYARSLKGSSNVSGSYNYANGDLFDDTFRDMIKNASERFGDINENELRKNMKVSDFRVHNQGQLGLTDEELNNSYFNTQNENFRFMKGNRSVDEANAMKNLTTDYEGTKARILNKPTNEQFTPQEVDEGMMAFMREIDNAREVGDGDYSKAAELIYRITQDAHDKGSGLQAYAKWKANSPVGVTLEANSVARDLAEAKLGKEGVENIDNTVKDLTEIINDTTKTAEEKLSEIDKIFKDFNAKGYSKLKHLSGYEQMKELLKTGKSTDSVTIKDILAEANKIPNIDAKAQLEITNLAQEMFGKELTKAEKQAYITKINRILSRQKGISKSEQATELAHMFMLSGMPTQSRNILANVGMLPQSSLANKISALGQNAYHLLNPDYKPTQAFHVTKESKNLANEVWDRVKDNIEDGTLGKYTGNEFRAKSEISADEMFPLRQGKDKNTLSQIPVLGDAFSLAKRGIDKGAAKVGAEGAFSGMTSDKSVVENARQGIYGLLELGDTPFVKKNYVNRLASYIEAQGFKNIDDIPDEALRIARDEALKATFKDDNAMTQLFQSIKRIPVIGELILPFTKTPANLINRGFEYSPVGIAKSLMGMLNNNSKYAKNTIGESVDELAKGLSGTTAMALGIMLYNNGILTGQKNEDTDIAKFMENEGWQDFSLSTKGIADFINRQLGTDIDLGDNYVSYSWLQPSTTNIVAGTVLADAFENNNFKDVESAVKTVKNLFSAYTDSMLDQSTLKSVAELFNNEYDDDGVGGNIFDEVLESPTRYLSGAVTMAQRLSDDNKRETYSKNKPVDTLKNTIQSKIPGLSDELPMKYDVLGEPITRSTSKSEQIWNATLNPASTTHRSDNPLYDVIDNVNDSVEEGNQYIPASAKRTINLTDGTKLDLDNKQYSEYTRIYGENRQKLLNEFVGNKDFNTIDPNDKTTYMNQLDSLADAIAKREISPDAKLTKDEQSLLDAYNIDGTKSIYDDFTKSIDENNIAIKDAIKNKEKGVTEASVALDYLESTKLTAREKGQYLYENLTENNTTKELAEKENWSGIYNFYKNKTVEAEKKAEETAKAQPLIDKLESYGLDNKNINYVAKTYEKASSVIPELTERQFANTYKKMDADGNNSLKQDEIIDYLNKTNASSEDGQKLWEAYGSSEWKKIPKLENGTWKKKSKK